MDRDAEDADGGVDSAVLLVFVFVFVLVLLLIVFVRVLVFVFVSVSVTLLDVVPDPVIIEELLTVV